MCLFILSTIFITPLERNYSEVFLTTVRVTTISIPLWNVTRWWILTFVDIILPDNVDPSFLAALPENIRQEVISDQLRLQRIRQRAQEQQQEAATLGVSEVNPEFLAALPPNIQEEVSHTLAVEYSYCYWIFILLNIHDHTEILELVFVRYLKLLC